MNISYILLAYNEQNYLERCFKTLMPLITIDDELIIVEGGSDDGTLDLLIKLINANPCREIRLEYNPSKNIGYKRNEAVKLAKYDVISYLDVDLYYPAKSATIRKYIGEYDFITTDYYSQEYNDYVAGDANIRLRKSSVDTPRIHTATVTEKKETALKYPFPVKENDDYDYYIEKYARMIRSNVKMLAVHEPSLLTIRNKKNYDQKKVDITNKVVRACKEWGFEI